MSRRLLGATGAILVAFVILSPEAQCVVRVVKFGASGFYWEIQTAITASGPGDTVLVYYVDPEDAYNETISIPAEKPITIRGYNEDPSGPPPTIWWNYSEGDHTPIVQIAAAATVENFFIRHDATFDEVTPADWTTQPYQYPGVLISGPGTLRNCSVGWCGIGVVIDHPQVVGARASVEGCCIGRYRPPDPDDSWDYAVANHYGVLHREGSIIGTQTAGLPDRIQHCQIRDNREVGLVLTGGSRAVVYNNLIVANAGGGILSNFTTNQAIGQCPIQMPLILQSTIADNQDMLRQTCGIDLHLELEGTPIVRLYHAGVVRDCIVSGHAGDGLLS